MEGRLNYKKITNGGYRAQSVFKERWFRLINNYLFYFKISEMGKFDTKNPAGAFVMENSSIQMEHGQSISFSFSISFIDEPEKRHIFAARSEDNVVQWVMKLRECTYEYLRNRLHTLQSKIYSITGKDPLLLVPRNEAYSRAAPSPPVRTKFSPATRHAEVSHDIKAFTEQGKHLGVTGILDEVPVPPRRKLSPKPVEKQVNNVPNSTSKENLVDALTEDLIQF
ncbi:unnamed protein product, partial [Iphiclides podalirius]